MILPIIAFLFATYLMSARLEMETKDNYLRE